MKVSVHLTFNGNCREAMDFYCDLLNGDILSVTTFGETPMGEEVPDGWQSKVVHGTISIGGISYATADIPPDRYQASQGINMFVEGDDPDEVVRVFEKLSEGGQVQIPIQETFWSKQFGMVIDRFGVPWEINCSQQDA